jgi:dTDP-4-dehydrorhamnose 3,5-epimerase
VIFTEMRVDGAWIIEPEPDRDDRGLFARTWSARELHSRGCDTRVAQCSVSFNTRAGTLRGMHYQAPPNEEAKYVRCTAGAAFDVVLDLRPDSPTYRVWDSVEISSTNRRTIYIPSGCAHGFQTLQDDTEIYYQISTEYVAESARGTRWDDAIIAINWPLPVSVMSSRDRSFTPLV